MVPVTVVTTPLLFELKVLLLPIDNVPAMLAVVFAARVIFTLDPKVSVFSVEIVKLVPVFPLRVIVRPAVESKVHVPLTVRLLNVTFGTAVIGAD